MTDEANFLEPVYINKYEAFMVMVAYLGFVKEDFTKDIHTINLITK